MLGRAGQVDTGSSLLGAEALWRHNLCCDCCGCFDPCDCSQTCVRRDLLIGFRYLNFSDRLTIREDLVPLDPIFVPGTETQPHRQLPSVQQLLRL